MTIGWAYYTYQEYLQFRDDWDRCNHSDLKCLKRFWITLKRYFSKGWNLLDIVLIISQPVNLLLTLFHYIDQGDYSQDSNDSNLTSPLIYFILVWAIQSAMWFKLFDWLRLFSQTAVFPVLQKEVLKDVTPYMLMMLILFGFFGNGIYIFHSFAKFKGDSGMDQVT